MIEDTMQRISYIQNDIDCVKDHFVEVIKDTSIPLNDRWKLFAETPDYLKNHTPWVKHFEQFGFDLDTDNYPRYAKVDMVSAIENMLDEAYFSEYPDNDERSDDYSYPENITKFQEHILSINLGSFIMDW